MSNNQNRIDHPSLTSLKIPSESGKGIDLTDFSLLNCQVDGETSVYFRNIEQRLIERIEESDCVFGCVAWLTSEPILKAIAKKSIAQLIIQKEDFLRPDIETVKMNYKKKLRAIYSKIAGVYRAHFYREIGIAISETWTIDSESERIEGVRCIGYRKQYHAELIPVMHHKFLVFCNYISPHDNFSFGSIDPYGIWTGSFNFTRNATRSFENAIFIKNRVIAKTFLREWGQLAALSEPLDWKHDYVAPEYWIGTGT